MERESNAMPQCRSGCGFYGNPAQDGLCSVCYKDFLRKKQQPPVSSTPSSNNGPQPPAPGQSVTASSVSLRSVVVTPQSFANSISGSGSSTTTSASSASATSSSAPPSTCAAAANNPAVAVTNTAQPTVHSALFCSDKDVKNPQEEKTCLLSGCLEVDEEGDEYNEYDDNAADVNYESDFFDESDDDNLIVRLDGGAENVGGPASDSESNTVPAACAIRTLEQNYGRATSDIDVVNVQRSVNFKKRKINADDSSSLGGHSNNSSIADNDEKDGDKDDAKKKKNRCATCRKKVGLTGFECRCGGLFCAIHRYSDKHECSFDYRELGAAEIRRNNPVVVGEKIQKI